LEIPTGRIEHENHKKYYLHIDCVHRYSIMRFINSPSCMLDIISVLNNIDASKRSFNSKNNIITTCKDEVILVNKQNSFYNNELSCTTLRSYIRKILELSELFISLLPTNSDNNNNNSNNNYNNKLMTKKKKNITTITASNTIKNATYILNLKETNDNNYLFKQLFITQIGADSDIKLNLLTKAQLITALHKIKIDIILQLLKLADDQIKFHSNKSSSSSSSSSNDVARDHTNEAVHFTNASGTDECINKSKDNIKKKRKICDLNKLYDVRNDCVENDRDRDGYENNDSRSSLHSIGDDDDDDSGSSLHSIEDDSDDDGYNVHTSAKMISISGDV